MKTPGTFIITEAGEKTSAPVFQPLFLTVWPALKNKATGIHFVSDGSNVSAEYLNEGKSVPLKVHKDYHPAVTFSRIRIACGMSIVPQELQAGAMQIGFDGHHADVSVEIKTAVEGESMLMKLTWR